MRVLHTSDWHLGKRLLQHERTLEHQHFLDWLLETIKSEKVDALIVAGDVFDTGTPSNTALKQYYDFLRELYLTGCKHVIITGGNHDSISTLNAPKELLKYFNIHVIGGVPANLEEEIIPLEDKTGEVQLVVCAVPFLRDKDVRLSIAGETAEEREQRIKDGICNHYKELVPYIKAYKTEGIPVLATGHLFAAGSSTSDSEKEIHVGNLGQIYGDQFPVEFDYVALGHLHRPQFVGGFKHVRYSGSPIPLSFSENDDRKIVLLLDFENGTLGNITEIPVPRQRRLVRFKGTLEKVQIQMLAFENEDCPLPAWAEVQVDTETFIPNLEENLRELLGGKEDLELITCRQNLIRAKITLDSQVQEDLHLHDLQPKEVFRKRCEAEFPELAHDDLLQTFDELLENMN
ncbi:exonuclease SbcCD subunit D C-terminal domain-containing protein [Adhaeribacter soli]|uniref:Nuclease SbcCD subunit D n=1 Tax=Adhaeribacter soli TaxID=2607655 RepID=A0A5N1J1R7_9BACT|nr:exonuclease SbcCD subunit D C-terminal domain-containing protein [Adhaeribacter soli]KAA9340529.1 exonuclease subunit SbcD [Adhaeribacter soli]